ncbi:MAG: SPASM domain-containing protein [Clostridiales bacterium]|nr:SPASM domain-containing protein [Clostridiales bacterium]
MVKPASSMCNIQCEYCFYRDVAQNREQFQFGIMSDSTAEELVKKSLLYADSAGVSYTFQGGEPLLAGLSYFKSFVEKVKIYNVKGSAVSYALQTNATLIDEDFARFFAENNFLVGVSLDGDFDSNKFRRAPGGGSTFNKVIKAARLLERFKVQYNIVSVLTDFSAKRGEKIYKFFKSKGFKYLQFIPCLRPFGSHDESELYMTDESYADFLIKVFRLYAADWAHGNYVSVRQFDNWVNLYLGFRCEQCGMEGRCTQQFVAEGNGNIYPCDFFCTDEYLLGNINDCNFAELASCDRARRFLTEGFDTPEKCKGCPYFQLCRAGGCKRTRQSADYCGAYKRFFSECLPLFRIFAG